MFCDLAIIVIAAKCFIVLQQRASEKKKMLEQSQKLLAHHVSLEAARWLMMLKLTSWFLFISITCIMIFDKLDTPLNIITLLCSLVSMIFLTVNSLKILSRESFKFK